MLGANGAGKSTLMNAICGVLDPTLGDVLVDGNSIRTDPLAAKREIGFLPQQAPLYPELSVDEYLVHCALLRRMPGAQIRSAVDAAKERMSLTDVSRRLIGALSGGYRQRVGLAQAILHRPRLVVLDEPTNGLDPVQIKEARRLIKDIAADCTVLLSTHILREVEALCDEIKMIDKGRVVFEGSTGAFADVVQPTTMIASFGPGTGSVGLEDVAGVESVESIGPRKYRLHLGAPAHDVSTTLIEASVSGNWDLKEVYFERFTLEEVFARLAGDGHTKGQGVTGNSLTTGNMQIGVSE